MARNDKQKRFVSEYLKDQNGTQAAIRAGYSPRTANEQASELLAKPDIRAKVDALLAKVQEKALKTKTEWLHEMELIGFADMADFSTVTDQGDVVLTPTADLKPGRSRVIQAVSKTVREFGKTTVTQVDFKLHDKQAALVHYGKAMGWLKNSVTLEDKDGNAQKFNVIINLPDNGRDKKG